VPKSFARSNFRQNILKQGLLAHPAPFLVHGFVPLIEFHLCSRGHHQKSGCSRVFAHRQFVVIPASSQSQGHMTLGEASIYGRFVADFLAKLPATH
jgi:hypothetical protein